MEKYLSGRDRDGNLSNWNGSATMERVKVLERRGASVCCFVLAYQLTKGDASRFSSFCSSCQCFDQVNITLEGGKPELTI